MAEAIPFDLGRGAARISLLKNLLDNTAERASAVFRATGVSSDTETITIGTDVFEIDLLAGANHANCAIAALADTADGAIHWTTITGNEAAAHGLVAGQYIKVENELIKVIAVNGTAIKVRRGASGTTAVAHAADTDYTQSATTAGRIPLGAFSNTAANLVKALVDAINNGDGNVGQSQELLAIEIEANVAVLLVARAKGVLALATTETCANGSFDNGTTMHGGVAAARKRTVSITRVPTAGEVTAGKMAIPVDLDSIGTVTIQVRVTSGQAAKAWDGAYVVVQPTATAPGYITLDNAGATDWAATDTVNVTVAEA